MQIIQLDISRKAEVTPIEAKQDDVGRKFQAQILENGIPYMIPQGAVVSLWYSGTSGEGNYSEIDGNNPFLVTGHTVTVELIHQMLSVPGGGIMCLVVNDVNGEQIGLWNIPYHVEKIPGAGSDTAEDYYSALSEMISRISPDASLSVAGRPADAKAVGDALALLAEEKSIIDYYEVDDDVQLDNTMLTIISHLENYSQKRCILFMTGTGASLPYGVWVFEITRANTNVQIRGVSGSKTVSRTYQDSLLKNASFEMVAEIPGWHCRNHGVSYISSDVVRSGAFSMMIRDTGTGSGAEVVSKPVAVTPDSSYTATVYVNGTAQSQAGIRFINASGEIISQSQSVCMPAAGSWSEISTTATAPEGAVEACLVFATTKATMGVSHFDDAQLVITGMSGNLLTNPSFEAEVRIPGWTSNSAASTVMTSEQVRFGNGCCSVKMIDNSSSTTVQLISDPVSITGGMNYGVSADFYGEGMSQLWIRFLDNTGAVLSQQYKSVIPKNGDWSHFSVIGYAPDSATKALVVLSTVKSTTATVFVDNVFLAPETELGSFESNAERFTPWVWANNDASAMTNGGTVDDLSQLSEIVYDALTGMAVPAAEHLAVVCDFTSRTSNGSLTLHKSMGMDATYEATAVLVTSNGDIMYGSTYDDSLEGQWQPIEWAWNNPPMDEGIEYRTVERHMGKAVYTKLVDLGTLPNNSIKSVAHNAAITQALRCSAYIVGSDTLPVEIEGGNWRVNVTCGAETVAIETYSNMGASTARAQIWYTKD